MHGLRENIRLAPVRKKSTKSGSASKDDPDAYAYPTVEDYEKCVKFKINEAFRIGWDMARTKNKHFTALASDRDACPERRRT